MNNDTQPLDIDGGTFEVKGEGLSDAEIEELRQQETLQAQNEMAVAINEQYEQIKRDFSQKINPFPVKNQIQIEKPSAEDQLALKMEQAQKNWQNLLTVFKTEPKPHVHGPFTFLMNQNHNALRGCQSCGAAWVGVMAGTEDSIRWHEVQEAPEEEEE